MEKVRLTGGGYEAVIAPGFGANCISLTHLASGAALLRTPEREEDLAKDPVLYGMPLLFPPNRIEDGAFDFAGKTYRFPINEPERRTHLHGTLCRTAFETVFAGESAAAFLCRATKERPYFDYDALSLRVEYTLDEAGLKQTVTIFNEGEEPIPVGLGFHTAVPLPFLPGGRAEDIRLHGALGAEYGRDPKRLLTVWEPLAESETHRSVAQGTFCPFGEGLSAQYLCGEDRTMRIVDQPSGIAVVYELSEAYVSWLLWKPQESDFLCVEPQSWLVNAPHAPQPERAGLRSLAPQESAVFSTRMYLLL